MKYTKAKQMNTIYHELVEKLDDEDGIMNIDANFKEQYIELIGKAYKEFTKLKQAENEQGNHGIRYTKCHYDSSTLDTYQIWFTTEKERDDVYDDFQKKLYWDEIFEDHLPYNQTRFDNFNLGKKVTRIGNKIYVEEK